MAQYLGTVQLGGFYNNDTMLKRPTKSWWPDGGAYSGLEAGDIPQMSSSMANYTCGNTPSVAATTSNDTRLRMAIRPSSLVTGSSSFLSHGTISTSKATS